MEREEYITNLIKNQGYTVKSFADSIGIANSTLRGMLNNMGGAGLDNVLKVCSALWISSDELLSEEFEEFLDEKSPRRS